MENLQVRVDPRIELLSIVQFFSDYGSVYRPLTELDSAYSQAVNDYFSNFKNHPVITLFGELVKEGFNFSDPIDLAFDLDFDLKRNSLVLDKSVSSLITKKVGRISQIRLFVQNMADYAEQTDFGHFYQTNKDFYGEIIDEVKTKLSSFNLTGAFENYYGVHYESYHLVLNALCDSGGYGVWRENEDGRLSAYSITGPIGIEEGILRFVGDPQGFCAFNWHEFGHSVVNSLTSHYLEEIAQFENLFEPIAEKMKAQAYGAWEFCFNEHIIRACVIRLLTREFGEKLAQELREYEKSIGFYLLDPLIEWLNVYEENRRRYKTFAEYFPSVMAVLAKL